MKKSQLMFKLEVEGNFKLKLGYKSRGIGILSIFRGIIEMISE